MAALVWILGGLLALVGALAYAEVVTLYPKAGGNYVLLREGYGRLFGFLWGWVEFFIIRSASIAALATIFTNSLHALCRELLHAEGDLRPGKRLGERRFVDAGDQRLRRHANAAEGRDIGGQLGR